MREPYYFWLVLFTAGTLVSFFWLIVILGHRRQRNFERVLFFLCLALLLFYGASLLAVNAELYYGNPAQGLLRFCWTLLCMGLFFLPALLVHLHLEYAVIRELLSSRRSKLLWLSVSYLPLVLFASHLASLVRQRSDFDFITPINQFGIGYEIWLGSAFVFSAYWHRRFARIAPDGEQKQFHQSIRWELLAATVWLPLIYYSRNLSEDFRIGATYILAMFPLIPLGTLIRKVQKVNFLQIGRQRNLMYAVFFTFIALLYMSLVRRVSLWLEPTLPPEATAAILLFLPVIFFEPLQRIMRTSLRKAAQGEMDATQRMMGPIREVARRGDSGKLVQFIGEWVGQRLELAKVELVLANNGGTTEQVIAGARGSIAEFPIRLSKTRAGKLRVTSYGAMLSGETWAAIESLCEQLPSILDLCHLIEEKLQLERELAERERLALVGQTAASISHNLKNPLGSIKTILQVQLENPEMPESMRAETRMVLDEISRLSVKLNQLLQFSRPSAASSSDGATCDIREVIRNVLDVLRPEAETKRVHLGSRIVEGSSTVDASAEAMHDVLSNLVVNAIEATPEGGEVKVQVSWLSLQCSITVEDEGSGIPQALQEKILQPFFTTKVRGTGLGLAIVAKRVAEFGGELNITSPISGERGARFEVRISPAIVRRTRGLPNNVA